MDKMYTFEKRMKRAEKIPRMETENPLSGGMPSLVDGASRKDLPEAIRTKMENAFGADFSNLNIYESEKVAEGGARAVTQGNTIAFAPGQFNVYSPSSEALLGHELSHVVSQARGESRGNGLLTDSYLEAKADREGVMAAAGQQVYSGPITPLSNSTPMSVAGPMQCKSWGLGKLFGRKKKLQVNEGIKTEDLMAEANRDMNFEPVAEPTNALMDEPANAPRTGGLMEYLDSKEEFASENDMNQDGSFDGASGIDFMKNESSNLIDEGIDEGINESFDEDFVKDIGYFEDALNEKDRAEAELDVAETTKFAKRLHDWKPSKEDEKKFKKLVKGKMKFVDDDDDDDDDDDRSVSMKGY